MGACKYSNEPAGSGAMELVMTEGRRPHAIRET